MKNKFKYLNRFLFSFLLLLVSIPSSIFANENPPFKIPTENDPMVYFEIHPENYERWNKKHKFSEEMLKVNSKKISESDKLFEAFKAKHIGEADSMMYQPAEWNCYEIDLTCKDNAGSYGNFTIESKHTKDEDTYNIWPEQFKMYVSRFDKETDRKSVV